MEKKIEVEIGGRIVRIMPHVMETAMKFGVISPKKVIKNPPKEIIIPAKMEEASKTEPAILPEMKTTIIPAAENKTTTVLPEMENTVTPTGSENKTNEKPKRKPPVRSKSKK